MSASYLSKKVIRRGALDEPKSALQRIQLNAQVSELEIELQPPRVITVTGLTKDRRIRQWHLKITDNQKLSLL